MNYKGSWTPTRTNWVAFVYGLFKTYIKRCAST